MLMRHSTFTMHASGNARCQTIWPGSQGTALEFLQRKGKIRNQVPVRGVIAVALILLESALPREYCAINSLSFFLRDVR